MESILISIKKVLGMNPCYEEAFDVDLIMHINSVFSILTQLGVGPEEGFSIQNEEKTWDDYTTDIKLEMVKSYIYAKVKLLFDPPSSSTILNAYQSYINEFEWRLNVSVDPEQQGVNN